VSKSIPCVTLQPSVSCPMLHGWFSTIPLSRVNRLQPIKEKAVFDSVTCGPSVPRFSWPVLCPQAYILSWPTLGISTAMTLWGAEAPHGPFILTVVDLQSRLTDGLTDRHIFLWVMALCSSEVTAWQRPFNSHLRSADIGGASRTGVSSVIHSTGHLKPPIIGRCSGISRLGLGFWNTLGKLPNTTHLPS
jgi:hypothetical protein